MALTPPDVAQRIDSISDQLSYKEINALDFNTVSALIVYTGCNINNIIYIYKAKTWRLHEPDIHSKKQLYTYPLRLTPQESREEQAN
jgi:hypothetical protein